MAWQPQCAEVTAATNRTTRQQFSTEPAAPHPSPLLLLCRALIENAFADAVRCAQGKPTAEALEALEWIESRTDWTRRKNHKIATGDGSLPIPSEDARKEFPGTFDWCCRWLNEDPDDVRQRGLPHPVVRDLQPGHGIRAYAPMRSRVARTSVHGKRHVAGVGAVREAWDRARQTYQARIAAGLVEETPKRTPRRMERDENGALVSKGVRAAERVRQGKCARCGKPREQFLRHCNSCLAVLRAGGGVEHPAAMRSRLESPANATTGHPARTSWPLREGQRGWAGYRVFSIWLGNQSSLSECQFKILGF